MESKMQNRNKKAECDVCNKLMRSDHLKRHKQTHQDLLSLPDNENELKTRQEIKSKEKKLQKYCYSAKKMRPELITLFSLSQCHTKSAKTVEEYEINRNRK